MSIPLIVKRNNTVVLHRLMPIHHLQHISKQHSQLELLATQLVEGSITGLHKSPFHGFSVEFAEHRPYNAGESTRHIDWKLLARSDKLFSKCYEEETNLRCRLLLDVSASMHYPKTKATLDINNCNKLGFSLLSAASIIQLLKKQRDAVGVTSFADKVLSHSECKSNNAHIEQLFANLQAISESHLPTTHPHNSNIDQALHYVADNIHKRSLLIIFSDLLNIKNFDKFIHALRHIKHQKHELILFHVFDGQREIDLDFKQKQAITFVDVESGERLKLKRQEIATLYQARMQAFQKDLKNKCAQYKIDFVSADIQKGFDSLFTTFLHKRKRLY